jgi:hypothetical protein
MELEFAEYGSWWIFRYDCIVPVVNPSFAITI